MAAPPPKNPFFPGYYVGDPVARPPKFIPGDPTPLDLDSLAAWINYLDVDVEGVPVWFKDQVVRELTVNLKAAITPKGLSMADLDMYGDEGMPGAFGVDVNLNPIDWIRDPKDQAGKTVQGWWKDFKSYEDYETKIEQALWNNIIKGTTPPSKLGKAAAQTLEEYHGGYGLQLVGVAPGKDTATGQDLDIVYNQFKADAYGSAGEKVVSFIMGAENPGTRDNRHTAFLSSAVQAISDDLKKNANTYVTNAGGAHFSEVAENFTEMADMAWSASGVFFMDPTSDYLAKYALEGDQELELTELDPTTERFKKTRTDLLSETNKKRLKIHGKADGAHAELAKIRSGIERDVRAGLKSQRDLLRYNRATAKLEKALKQLVGDTTNPITGRDQAYKLMRRISIAKESITRGDMLNPGAETQFLRYLEDEMANTGDNAIGGLIERGGMINAQKLQHIRKYADTERRAHTIEEFVSSIEKGKFGDYLFRRLRTWSYGYTAGYVANRILTETHHFGLIVNEDTFGIFPGTDALGTSKIGRKFRDMIQSDSGIAKFLFRNKFDVEVSVGGTATKVGFEGGSYLGAITAPGGLYSIVKEGIPSATGLGLNAIHPKNLSILLKDPGLALTNAYFQKNGKWG